MDSSTAQNKSSSTAPGTPILFGDFMLDASQDNAPAYKNSNRDSFVVTYDLGETVETNAARPTDIGKAGKRTYGKDFHDMSMCLTEPCSDTVAMLTPDKSSITFTEISGNFLEVQQ